uniref:Uncharacterized protein n=1 Tax=Nelumbo nucifera TaxID=4432 RepID=A0A822Z034_NELNU|nr:TPA_asm: hypothetical protein HUJ06_014037 [Nelumbo nucifera]
MIIEVHNFLYQRRSEDEDNQISDSGKMGDGWTSGRKGNRWTSGLQLQLEI